MGFCAEHSAIAAMVTQGENRIVTIVAVHYAWRVFCAVGPAAGSSSPRCILIMLQRAPLEAVGAVQPSPNFCLSIRPQNAIEPN